MCRHLSPVCMDFLRRLLVKDPNMRMSTNVALSHPFISGSIIASQDLSTSPSASAGAGAGAGVGVGALSAVPHTEVRFTGPKADAIVTR